MMFKFDDGRNSTDDIASFRQITNLTNKASVRLQLREQHDCFFQLPSFQRPPTGPTVQGGTQEPRRAKLNQSCWESKSICNHHLRSACSSLIASGHSNLPKDDRCSSTNQCSWQGGDRSPVWCSSEESQHGSETVVSIIISPRNNKCLQSGHMSSNDYIRITLVEGKAAQTWPYLLSGSLGSSSTKPLMLYLHDFDLTRVVPCGNNCIVLGQLIINI